LPRATPARVRRPPASGGYAAGRRTRARIILAALRVFGEQGFDHASTRQIARRAGVNAPAIQYYFGSKHGLHVACTRHVNGRMSSLLAPRLVRARDALRTAEPAVALDALCELLVTVLKGLEFAGFEHWSGYLAGVTQDGDTAAQAMVHAHGSAGLFETLARLIAAVTGQSAEEQLTRLRACVLLGQVGSWYGNRAHRLSTMGWSQLDEHALTLIKSVVREHTRAALAASLASSMQTERQHRGPSWAPPAR
jgi:AcrR family transcriptional regulator